MKTCYCRPLGLIICMILAILALCAGTGRINRRNERNEKGRPSVHIFRIAAIAGTGRVYKGDTGPAAEQAGIL